MYNIKLVLCELDLVSILARLRRCFLVSCVVLWEMVIWLWNDRLIKPLIIIFDAGEECFWVVYKNKSGVHLIPDALKAFWLLFCFWEDDQRCMERESTFTLVAICTEDCIEEVDRVNSGFDPLAFPFISRAVAIWNWSTQSSFQFRVYVFSFQLSLNRNDYGCFSTVNGCQYEQPLKLGHDIMTYLGFSSQTWIWVWHFWCWSSFLAKIAALKTSLPLWCFTLVMLSLSQRFMFMMHLFYWLWLYILQLWLVQCNISLYVHCISQLQQNKVLWVFGAVLNSQCWPICLS